MQTIINATNHLYHAYDNDYIDFRSGMLNVTFGHDSKVIHTALQRVLSQGFVSRCDINNPIKMEFDELMKADMPHHTWHPANTGAEAVEKAIQSAQMIRRSKGLPVVNKVLVMPGCFHGKSITTSPFHYGSGLPWKGINFQYLPHTLKDFDPGQFDAILIEPIQGTLNGSAWGESFAQELQDFAYEHDAVLISDEMITGYYRCGQKFHVPDADILICGKALSQGVPFTMIGVSNSLQFDMPIGWTSTGANNQISLAIAVECLKEYRRFDYGTNNLRYYDIVKNVFTDYDVNGRGALAFVDLINANGFSQILKDSGFVMDIFANRYLRFAPCFTFDFVDFEYYVNSVRTLFEQHKGGQ